MEVLDGDLLLVKPVGRPYDEALVLQNREEADDCEIVCEIVAWGEKIAPVKRVQVAKVHCVHQSDLLM